MNEKQKSKGLIWQYGILVGIGVFLLLSGIFSVAKYYQDAAVAKETTEVPWFDLYSPSEELQGLEFLFVSDAFAEYTYGTSQGFYLVYDEDMYGYIVCMEHVRVNEEFYANYEYTYSDTQKVPELGYVEGYAVEIDEDLREYAIDFFNVFWDEELLNEENFEDYLGFYYLDTTAEPAMENNNVSVAAVKIIVGMLLVIVALVQMKNHGKRMKEQEEEERQRILRQAAMDAHNPYMNDSEILGGERGYGSSVEIEPEGNKMK